MGRGPSALTVERLDAIYAYAEENHPVTVRGCCYHLFTKKLIESMATKHTKEISRILVTAREDEIIPWEWIVDESRELEGGGGWDNIEQAAQSWARHYKKDRWLDQDTHIELWSEKGTVRGLLAPVIDKYQIPFRNMHGFTSATSVNDIAGLIARTADEGKDFVALYVGDWDPSGLHMSEVDLPERLQRYRRIIPPNGVIRDGNGHLVREDHNGELSRCLTRSQLAEMEARLDDVDFTIKRIALLEDDLEDLPSFPLESKEDKADKKGDSRAPWYKRNYHPTLCWELDAMNPRALRARVEDEITGYIDQELWARVEEGERAERESIRQFAESLKSLPRR